MRAAAGGGSTPTISVLTPVYNGERHLADCIESVLAQSRTDWEYLIVDNCSQDRSVAIAERYAADDGRIRVVRCTEFVNVHRSFSRSARLMHPRAAYCKFLAADDRLYPQCLEGMISVAERHPTVGLVSAYRLDDDRVTQTGVVPYPEERLPGSQVMRTAFLRGQYVTGSPSQLLYRADLVRRADPFFDETVWHSDTDAAFRTLLGCDLGFVHQVLTYTRRHPGALTSSSVRVNTYLPNDIRLLIRFGHQVLTAQEYRAAIRLMLARYAWFLLRQSLRPSRLHDAEFHAYHRAELLRMLSELHGDRRSTVALKSLRLLTRNLRAAGVPSSPVAG
ncbi:MAG TPA: glycosyltransferase family 2 protein [Steroidobacteraceae bacterium]|jgi:glycosyltransferase involved in cell wall biosynthesis|nr:glycosyltransferase family 2 protein [Steroidobacteraceae bacterium]